MVRCLALAIVSCLFSAAYAQEFKIYTEVDMPVFDFITRQHPGLNFVNRHHTVHETVHMIHSRIRAKDPHHRDGNKIILHGAVYLESGEILFDNPSTTLKAVYDKMWFKSDRIEHYLKVQQVYWNEQPYYILDELAAYTWDMNTMICDIKTNSLDLSKDVTSTDSAFALIELSWAAKTMCEIDTDPKTAKVTRRVLEWSKRLFEESQNYKLMKLVDDPKNPRKVKYADVLIRNNELWKFIDEN